MSAIHFLEITDQNRPNHVLMRPKNVIKVQADSFGAADLCGFANRICEGTEQIPPAFPSMSILYNTQEKCEGMAQGKVLVSKSLSGAVLMETKSTAY